MFFFFESFVIVLLTQKGSDPNETDPVLHGRNVLGVWLGENEVHNLSQPVQLRFMNSNEVRCFNITPWCNCKNTAWPCGFYLSTVSFHFYKSATSLLQNESGLCVYWHLDENGRGQYEFHTIFRAKNVLLSMKPLCINLNKFTRSMSKAVQFACVWFIWNTHLKKLFFPWPKVTRWIQPLKG